jgi:hypothetical protein
MVNISGKMGIGNKALLRAENRKEMGLDLPGISLTDQNMVGWRIFTKAFFLRSNRYWRMIPQNNYMFDRIVLAVKSQLTEWSAANYPRLRSE